MKGSFPLVMPHGFIGSRGNLWQTLPIGHSFGCATSCNKRCRIRDTNVESLVVGVDDLHLHVMIG